MKWSTAPQLAALGGVYTPPPPPPLPIQLNATLWFDPSDSATLFQERTGASATTPAAVGDPVGTWKNKGTAGGYLVTPTSDAKRPVRRNDGTRYYLEFDGTTNSKTLAAQSGTDIRNAFTSVSAGTIGVLVWVHATTSQYFVHAFGGTGGVRCAIANLSGQSRWILSGRRLDADTTATQNSTTAKSIDTYYSVIAQYDWANAKAYIFTDGAADGTKDPFQTTGSTSGTSGNVWVGSNNGGYLDGRLGHVVATQTILNGTDIALLHTFLTTQP